MKRQPTWRRWFNRVVWGLSLPAAVAWAVVTLTPADVVGVVGPHRGLAIRSLNGHDVFIAYSEGWPNRAWLSRPRPPAAAPGDPSFYFSYEKLGLGFARETRRWNGNAPVVVEWRGVALPGAYCLMIAVAPWVERWWRRAVGRDYTGAGNGVAASARTAPSSRGER